MQNQRTFYSMSEISRAVGKPTHSIRYICTSRRLEPAGKVGQTLIFSEEQMKLIAEEARAIDAKNAAKAAAGVARRARPGLVR